MKRMFTLFLSLVLFTNLTIFAAIPSGYYSAADNKKGAALLSALHNCIDGHTTLSYKSLENYYEDTDWTSDGYVWDMYSTCKFTMSDGNGSQKKVCDAWNKEHSVPQSWFKEQSPMKSDLFHVYPACPCAEKRSARPAHHCQAPSPFYRYCLRGSGNGRA